MTEKTPERTTISALLEEVMVERLIQIEQWGQQDHPSMYGEGDRRGFEKAAGTWKQINAARVELDTLSWDGILIEEVYEALAESDDDLRRAELIQVAAVALAEIECIDRRAAQEPEDEAEADEVEA